MTVKDLMEIIHCSTKDNISYHIYNVENVASVSFKTYAELLNFSHYETNLLNEEIVYFSLVSESLHFTLSIRIKNKVAD